MSSSSPKRHCKYSAEELEIEEHYEWLHKTLSHMESIVNMWEHIVYKDTKNLVCTIISPSSIYYLPMLNCTHWYLAMDIQLKADEEAANLGIPAFKVPKIMDIWARRREELARGRSIHLLETFLGSNIFQIFRSSHQTVECLSFTLPHSCP
jgi:hypothetical protein